MPLAKLNRGCLSWAILHDATALIKYFSREFPGPLFPPSETHEALTRNYCVMPAPISA